MNMRTVQHFLCHMLKVMSILLPPLHPSSHAPFLSSSLHLISFSPPHPRASTPPCIRRHEPPSFHPPLPRPRVCRLNFPLCSICPLCHLSHCLAADPPTQRVLAVHTRRQGIATEVQELSGRWDCWFAGCQELWARSFQGADRVWT